MIVHKAILSAVLIAASFTGAHADIDGAFVSIDSKIATCGDLIKADRSKKGEDDRRAMLMEWVGGFITAYNAKTPGVSNVTDKYMGQARIALIIEMLRDCQNEKPNTWLSRVLLNILDSLRDELPQEAHKVH
jgi:hypothetical protein